MTEEQFRYLPDTAEDEKEMLAVIGVKSMEDLFTDIPEEIRQKEELAIPSAVSESELLKQMKALAEKNVSADHYIPSVVDAVISRSEFYTAYTPYQAEASQGELQAIFEFQSMISELTGMEATNSSLYDGFASLSEAVGLAAAVTKRNEIVLSQAVHPNARAVIHAAAKGRGLDVIEVLMEKDVTNFNVTRCLTTPDTAAIVVQYPNFFGSVEDLAVVKKIAEDKGALLIVMANPLALGILEAPGNLGADIVVGDTQPFGLPMSFGGPHCGYFSVNQKHIRKVPGRIVGETVDAAGERAFVLTLQSREQHIRREKATSYMSSNQALNALASAVCMAALGKQGVQEMAQLNVDKAAYFAQALQAKGFAILNQAPFFNEFVIDLSFPAEEANRALLEAGIIGGYSLAETYHKPNQLLVCATEKRTKEEIDRFIAVLEGMNHA